MQAVQTLRVITFYSFLRTVFFQGNSSIVHKELSLSVGCFSAYGSNRPAHYHFCFATPGHCSFVLPALLPFGFHVPEGDELLPLYTEQAFIITVMISGYRKL